MSPGSEASVGARNLSVSFSRWGQELIAVADVTLTVAAGEWVALTGDNGAGKSTLLRALAGLVKPTSGEVLLGGRPLSTVPPRERAEAMLMIHQDPTVGAASLLTVLENMRVATRSGGFRECREVLEQIGLWGRAHHPTKTLSGGERQLLALAIARLRRPAVLLLDEPLSALAPENALACVNLIAATNANGTTVLQVTHDLPLLASRIHRTVGLAVGRVCSDVPTPLAPA